MKARIAFETKKMSSGANNSMAIVVDALALRPMQINRITGMLKKMNRGAI